MLGCKISRKLFHNILIIYVNAIAEQSLKYPLHINTRGLKPIYHVSQYHI